MTQWLLRVTHLFLTPTGNRVNRLDAHFFEPAFGTRFSLGHVTILARARRSPDSNGPQF